MIFSHWALVAGDLTDPSSRFDTNRHEKFEKETA